MLWHLEKKTCFILPLFIFICPFRSSFSKEFHHTGGDTPEKYDANQSSIAPDGTPNYVDRSSADPQHQQQYGSGRRGYDQYGREPHGKDQYDGGRGGQQYGYGNADGSWNQQYGYGAAADGSYVQEPAKPG